MPGPVAHAELTFLPGALRAAAAFLVDLVAVVLGVFSALVPCTLLLLPLRLLCERCCCSSGTILNSKA